jgi:hypothetical protein
VAACVAGRNLYDARHHLELGVKTPKTPATKNCGFGPGHILSVTHSNEHWYCTAKKTSSEEV